MKSALRLVSILLLSASGCSYFEYSVQNVVLAPVNFVDETVFCYRLHLLARSTWKKIACDPDKQNLYTHAYAHGFEAGFVDYINRGGGETPAMPPYHLQRSALCDPAKQGDMEDWFAGFRHGVRVAQETGLRQRVLVPISLPPRPQVDPAIQGASSTGSGSPQAPTPDPVVELPAPRLLPEQMPNGPVDNLVPLPMPLPKNP